MSNNSQREIPPVLDPDLYKVDPLWFRGAVAWRLLSMMIPKALTKALPRILSRPLIPPGFVFPPGWTPGDPLPEYSLDPPTIPPGAGNGITGPPHLNPWTPGPPHPNWGGSKTSWQWYLEFNDNNFYQQAWPPHWQAWNSTWAVYADDNHPQWVPIGTWSDGFRPLIVQVAMGSNNDPWKFKVVNTNSDIIAESDYPYIGLTHVAVDPGPNFDIAYIEAYRPDDGYFALYITHIFWYAHY